MSDPTVWIRTLRSSHDRFAALLSPLDEQAVQRDSYASEWSIAQVASHLGSQAEIFGLFLDAGLAGTDAPGSDVFTPIWDDWNARTPARQVADSVAADEKLVSRLERLDAAERDRFTLSMFGHEMDLTGLATERLAEHTLHTWDIAVALDPRDELPTDAVDLLVDTLSDLAGRVGKPADDARTIVVETVAPQRRFALTLGPEVQLTTAPDEQSDEPAVTLPAAALIRLIYGRMDAAHTPAQAAQNPELAGLRRMFPGF